MVALYDLTMAAISLIACCLPAVLMALIIEAILDRTDKSSITIFTAIAIAFLVYVFAT